MFVFWHRAPGPYWHSVMAKFLRRCWVSFWSSSVVSGALSQPSGNAEGNTTEYLRGFCTDNLLPERHPASSTPSPAFHLLQHADKHRTSCLPSHTNSKNTMRSKHPPEPNADTPKRDLAHTHTHTRFNTAASTDTVELQPASGGKQQIKSGWCDKLFDQLMEMEIKSSKTKIGFLYFFVIIYILNPSSSVEKWLHQ